MAIVPLEMSQFVDQRVAHGQTALAVGQQNGRPAKPNQAWTWQEGAEQHVRRANAQHASYLMTPLLRLIAAADQLADPLDFFARNVFVLQKMGDQRGGATVEYAVDEIARHAALERVFFDERKKDKRASFDLVVYRALLLQASEQGLPGAASLGRLVRMVHEPTSILQNVGPLGEHRLSHPKHRAESAETR